MTYVEWRDAVVRMGVKLYRRVYSDRREWVGKMMRAGWMDGKSVGLMATELYEAEFGWMDE